MTGVQTCALPICGQSLADGSTAATPLFSSLREENANESLPAYHLPMGSWINGSMGIFVILKKSATDFYNRWLTSLIHQNLDIVPAGSIPPNPSELLGTKRFKNILKVLIKAYDFVIIDLPPISSVSDALVVAGDVDGMIVVVRQDLCTQSLLADTMRQLSVVKDKILGFVYNGATSESKKYNKKYYKYGYGYGYGKRHQRSSNDS